MQKKFFRRRVGYGQKHNSEKSGKKSKSVAKNYVNKATFTPYFFTKNGPVENTVENVENSRQSMEKPIFAQEAKNNFSNFLRKKGGFLVAKFRVTETQIVNSYQSVFAEKVGFFKNCAGKNREEKPSRLKFCENHQSAGKYLSPPNGNTGSKAKRRIHHAGKSRDLRRKHGKAEDFATGANGGIADQGQCRG